MSAANSIQPTKTAPLEGDCLNHLSEAGLLALLRAYTYADDARVDSWEFALEIHHLYDEGLTVSDLRWLLAKGFVEHGIDQSTYGESSRSFERSNGYIFAERTCFVLTPTGATFASGLVQNGESAATNGHHGANGDPSPVNGASAGKEDPSTPVRLRPTWHAARRELYLGDVLVKRFRVPARNQEWILEVFEEDRWPEYIDDPLPPSPDICSKTRLHATITRLNKNQANPILRFHGNGNGRGIFWKLVEPRGENGVTTR